MDLLDEYQSHVLPKKPSITDTVKTFSEEHRYHIKYKSVLFVEICLIF